MRLVVASANPGKVAEIEALFDGVAELVPRPAAVGDVTEDGPTLEANARLKARAVSVGTGEPAVADDTGLFVEALNGAPGVHTARFARPSATDADNRRKLLAELARVDAVAPGQRHARFRTVALVWFPDGTEIVAEGVVEGVIASEERGERGFGFDPLFVPDDGEGRTFAEMSAEEKHRISHRGRAFRALATLLAADPHSHG
ncbi:MAG: RdgB/HAM1 family non-canonical purine NTP pyrophosphatase [Actinomycetota bacterium]|nr:RdgB/HAM1 family non-canonical purine NTP pyrophosphatase [Actinomycetota bacterium]